jgi:FkbM family methyltransferase
MILKKIIKNLMPYRIKGLFVNFTVSLKGNQFCFFYNLFSYLFFKSQNKLTFLNERYFIEERGDKIWSFSHPDRGLWYLKGVKDRGKKLHKDYGIHNLKFKSDDIVIDCGADVGDFYAGFDTDVRYIGIEPSPINYPNLKHNAKNNKTYNVALWKSSQKEISFFESNITKKKSITKVIDQTREIKVKTMTLDQIIDDANDKIKLIKIEGTGSEPEILEGLKRNIEKVEYITVDASFERGVEKEHTVNQCANYLIQNNYEMIDFLFKKVCILFRNKNYRN